MTDTFQISTDANLIKPAARKKITTVWLARELEKEPAKEFPGARHE